MARDDGYTRFLRDPDPARRAEFEAFVGPNAAPFLKMYDRLRERPERPGAGMYSFVALAFFLGPCWFFYRKVWVWAWAVVAVQVVLALLPVGRGAGIGLAVALSMFGRYTYLQHAFARIARLRGESATADTQRLAREGGVSRVAGWVSAFVYLAAATAAVVALIVAEEGRGAY